MTADPVSILAEAVPEQLRPRQGTTSPAQVWCVFDRDGIRAAGGFGIGSADPLRRAFRIASCTKSFTAATTLLLVDEGVFDLGDPLEELLDVPLRFLGEGAPTVEHALSMQTGLPEDDPWADRQESQSPEAFAEMLAGGVRAAWPVGRYYEYSNLGYTIAGRVLEHRSAEPYIDLVSRRLLEPLGLDATGFDRTVAAPSGVEYGYRSGPEGWERQPFSGPGAFSPMAGLFSTLEDLATWCRTLGDATGLLPARITEALRQPRIPIQGRTGEGAWTAYALGLVVRDDGAGHRYFSHSGGYPGYASHMTWEQESGIGAIAFENAPYTELAEPLRAAMETVFGPELRTPEAAPKPHALPWPETVDTAETLRRELAAGRIESIELFDPCVWQDEPLERRRGALEQEIASAGDALELSPISYPSPARAHWSMSGPSGSIECTLWMTPLTPSRVQVLKVRRADHEVAR